MDEIVCQRHLVSWRLYRIEISGRGLISWDWNFELETLGFPSIHKLGWSARGDMFILWILFGFKILPLVGCDVFLILCPVEERKVERVGLLVLRHLLGVICQSSWWAYHNTSAIITGLHRLGQFLIGMLRLERMIWFLILLIFSGVEIILKNLAFPPYKAYEDGGVGLLSGVSADAFCTLILTFCLRTSW